MAVLPLQGGSLPVTRQATATTTDTTSPFATGIAFFSLLLIFLIAPPMLWHARNRNIGATVIIAWLIVLLFFTFVNAILWGNVDLSTWSNGIGLCDLEIRIQVASQVAFPACFACILRALAAVLDTARATLLPTKAQRWRNTVIDVTFCVIVPLLQIPLHFVVQSTRYYIFGIAGCVPGVSKGWLSILLLVVPSLIWTLVDCYYAVLILIRLYRYRLSFKSILAYSNTPKSRFTRLYLLCVIWIVGAIPVGSYILYYNISDLASGPFIWNQVHTYATWHEIIMVPANGTIWYDRWIWLVVSTMIFVFFGFGKEAITMYRTGLLAIGLGRIFPGLKKDHRSSSTTAFSSLGSKAKLLLKRKSMASTATMQSHTSSASDELSPNKTSFLDTIDEGNMEKSSYMSDRNTFDPGRSSVSQWSAAVMPNKKKQRRTEAGSLAPVEVIVRREVRQASEHEMVGLSAKAASQH